MLVVNKIVIDSIYIYIRRYTGMLWLYPTSLYIIIMIPGRCATAVHHSKLLAKSFSCNTAQSFTKLSMHHHYVLVGRWPVEVVCDHIQWIHAVSPRLRDISKLRELDPSHKHHPSRAEVISLKGTSRGIMWPWMLLAWTRLKLYKHTCKQVLVPLLYLFPSTIRFQRLQICCEPGMSAV